MIADGWKDLKRNKQSEFFCLDEERNEQSKPEEILEPEEDGSDNPDNELGAVMEFDEDELDEAQTEAEVKNITNKHHITIEELKREVLGSVRKKDFFLFWSTPFTRSFFLQYWARIQQPEQHARATGVQRLEKRPIQAFFRVLIDFLFPPRFNWFLYSCMALSHE